MSVISGNIKRSSPGITIVFKKEGFRPVGLGPSIVSTSTFDGVPYMHIIDLPVPEPRLPKYKSNAKSNAKNWWDSRAQEGTPGERRKKRCKRKGR